MLERVGISLDRALLAEFDRLIAEKGYANRSEAVRDLLRDALVQREWADEAGADGDRVAVVTLVYDHASSAVVRKLAEIQHASPRAVVSALHVHLDAHHCLEVIVLRGKAREVLALGDGLVSTRGVVHGKLTLATTGAGLR